MLAAAPAAFPWAKEVFAVAAKLRDDGEKMLFEVRSREDQVRAAELLKQAESAFVAAAGQLAVVQAACAQVRAASTV